LQDECVSCKDIPSLATSTPIVFAAALKYCAGSSLIDELLEKVNGLKGRDGIGISSASFTTIKVESLSTNEPD